MTDFDQALLQFIDVTKFCLVDLLPRFPPNCEVNRVQIWAVGAKSQMNRTQESLLPEG